MSEPVVRDQNVAQIHYELQSEKSLCYRAHSSLMISGPIV